MGTGKPKIWSQEGGKHKTWGAQVHHPTGRRGGGGGGALWRPQGTWRQDRTGGLKGGARSGTHGGAGSSGGHGGSGDLGGHSGSGDSGRDRETQNMVTRGRETRHGEHRSDRYQCYHSQPNFLSAILIFFKNLLFRTPPRPLVRFSPKSNHVIFRPC